ncbi:MAG: OmpA family protein [Bacteroidota bacterium]
MKKAILLGLTVAVMVGTGCSSSKFNKGNTAYNQMSYYKASQYYAAYLQNHNNRQAMIRLADSYRQMHDYGKAEYWYEKVVVNQASYPEEKLHYATALKMNGKYDEAKEWFAKYLDEAPGDAAAMAQMNSCDSIETYKRFAKLYKVEPVTAFGNVSNFSMIPYEEGFVFNSEKPVKTKVKTNPWNGRPYLNIMYARLSGEQLESPQSFSSSLNTPYHNGPVAFSSDYSKLYYSRSNYNGNRLARSSDKVNTIKIYSANRNGNEWAGVSELPFNSNDYSCGHPTLSADGNTMYFISDMPGSMGKTDIYMSTNANGTWSQPVNLGSNVNTSGHEMFPYYFKDSNGTARLYYSSDGRPGMGGLDMYFIEQQADGSWSAPVHLGAPFNSSKDDFGLTLKNNAAMGYFSSSRDGNGDIDMLYTFNKDQLRFAVEGVVYNKATNKTVKEARVQINNVTTGNKDIHFTQADGRFFAPLEVSSEYSFTAHKPQYLSAKASASTIGRESDDVVKVVMYLDSLDDVLSLTKIYYDFDKYEIRPDAAQQLDKLAEVMKENPELKLELDAHADARGSNHYNVKLTERRAKAVTAYLSSRGITPYRLYAKWYGKAIPANECVDGVVCSPAKHEQNRRTEFKALSNPVANTLSKK